MFSNKKHHVIEPEDKKKLPTVSNLSLPELHQIISTRANSGNKVLLKALSLLDDTECNQQDLPFAKKLDKLKAAPEKLALFCKILDQAKESSTIEAKLVKNVFYYQDKLDKEKNTEGLFNNTLSWLAGAHFCLADIHNNLVKVTINTQEYFKHAISVYKHTLAIINLTEKFINPCDSHKKNHHIKIESNYLFIESTFVHGVSLSTTDKNMLSFANPELLQIIREINQYANQQIQKNSPFKIFHFLRIICSLHLYPFDIELLEDDLNITLQEEKSVSTKKIFYHNLEPCPLSENLLVAIYNNIHAYIGKCTQVKVNGLEKDVNSLTDANELIAALRLAAQSFLVFQRIQNTFPQSKYLVALRRITDFSDDCIYGPLNELNILINFLHKELLRGKDLFVKAKSLAGQSELQKEKINDILKLLINSQDQLTQMSALFHYPQFASLTEICNKYYANLYSALAEVNIFRRRFHSDELSLTYYHQAVADINKSTLFYFKNIPIKKEDLIAAYKDIISIIKSGIRKSFNNSTVRNNIATSILKLYAKLIVLSPTNEALYFEQTTYHLLHKPPLMIDAIESISQGIDLVISKLQGKYKSQNSSFDYSRSIKNLLKTILIALKTQLIREEYLNINAASNLIALISKLEGLGFDYKNSLKETSRYRACASVLNNDFKSYHSDVSNLMTSITTTPHAISNEKLIHFICKIEQAHIAFDIGSEECTLDPENTDTDWIQHKLSSAATSLEFSVKYYEEAVSIIQKIPPSDSIQNEFFIYQTTLYRKLKLAHELLYDIYLKQTEDFDVDKVIHSRRQAKHYAKLLTSSTTSLTKSPKSHKGRKKSPAFKPSKTSFPTIYKLNAEREKERRSEEEMKQHAIASEMAAKHARELAEATAAIEAKKAVDDQAEQVRLEKIRQEEIAQTKELEQKNLEIRDANRQQKKIEREKIRAAEEAKRAEDKIRRAAEAAKRAEEEAKRDAALEKQWHKNLAEAAKIKADKTVDSAKAQREFEKKAFLNTIISKNQLDTLFNFAMDLKNNLGAKVEFGGSLIPKLALFLNDKNKTPMAIHDIDISVCAEYSKEHVYDYNNSKSKNNEKITLLKRLEQGKFVERVRSDEKARYNPPFSNHQKIIKKTSDAEELKIDLAVSYPGDKPKENLIPFTEQRMKFTDKPDPQNLSICFAKNRYLVFIDRGDKFIERCEKGEFWLNELPDPYKLNITGYFDRLYGAYNKIKGTKIKICKLTEKALSESWQITYFTRRFFAKDSAKYQKPCYLEMAQLIRKGRMQQEDYRQPLKSFCSAALLHQHHNKQITELIDSYYHNQATTKLPKSAEASLIAEIDKICKGHAIDMVADNITTILQLFYQEHSVESETISTSSIKDLFTKISEELFKARWSLQKKLTEEDLQTWVRELEKLCPELNSPSTSSSDSSPELAGYSQNGLFGITGQQRSSLSSLASDASLAPELNHSSQKKSPHNNQIHHKTQQKK